MNKLETIETEAVEVRLDGVTKVFESGDGEVIAVDDFTAVFPPGQLTTLLGPSGCGKTTTLRCIGGLSEPEKGDVFIGGERVNGMAPYNRPTGTVFQSYALFPHMTVFENVAYGLKVNKQPKKEIKEKVDESLRLLGLGGMGDRNSAQLSGGQQQRVAVARILVLEPKVILFDEPLSNLDAKMRVSMRDQIRDIQTDIGITSIYVTHDQEEAMSISDDIIVMNKGRIEQIGTPLEIYASPANAFVAEFIGLINLIESSVVEVNEDAFKVELFDTSVELPASKNNSFEEGEVVQIALRPEAIYFSDKTPDSFAGKIVKSTFLGPKARYKIETVNGKVLIVDVPNPKSVIGADNKINLQVDIESLTVQKSSPESDQGYAYRSKIH